MNIGVLFFSRKDIAKDKIASWLLEVPSFPPSSDSRWEISRQHVAKAVTAARESSPGPDGIPYKAWKVLGHLSIDVLFDAAKFLQRQDSLQYLPDNLNQAFLVCLPKKPSGTDVVHGDFYDAKNTRPQLTFTIG